MLSPPAIATASELPKRGEGSILFTPPLLRAVLTGAKTQTRRPVRPALSRVADGILIDGSGALIPMRARVGDTLWVREKWARLDDGSIVYAVDEPTRRVRWISSRFMPRTAARHHLLVRSVGVARLNEVDDAAAIREGAAPDASASLFGPRAWFISIWDAIYGEGEFASRNDPWVWVIEFSVLNAE